MAKLQGPPSPASEVSMPVKDQPSRRALPPVHPLLRWPLRLYQGLASFLVLALVGNIAVLLFSKGASGFLPAARTQVAALLAFVQQYPLWSALAAASLILLFLLALRADQEYKQEVAARTTAEQQQQAIEAGRAAAEAAIQEAVSAGRVTPSAVPPQPLGPPDDVALLPAPEHFVGRAADLEWVLDRLRQGGAAAITALRGLAGIGKTALAAVAVRQLQQEGRFPDGVAVVLCQGLTDPAEVLRRVLIRFDPYRRAPEATELPRLQDTAQATLRGKQALVVLDNVEPDLPVAAVVAPLREVGLTLLLTARHTLPSEAVPAEASHQLDLLTPEEALELFALMLGRGGPDALSPAEHAAAEQIVRELDRHTLAVRLAGAYAASERRDLGALARELADPAQGLALPGDDETPEAVRRSFALSLDSLPLDARRLFAGLAAFATPECGRQAALALGAALGQAHPERSVHLLVVRALAEPSVREALPAGSDRERVRLHPLVRAFAEGLFRQWPPAEQDTAALAVAQHFATYAEAHQGDDAVLAADEGNLTGALEWAQAHGRAALVADLAHGLRQFWNKHGRFREGARFLAWGVEAAEAGLSVGESRAACRQAAELNLAYGRLLIYSGQPETGEAPVQRSLEGFRLVEDRQGEGAALSALGEAALYRGQYEVAEAFLQQGLAICREVGDRQGEGVNLYALGQVALYRGQLEAAEAFLQQSLAICREVGDRQTEGVNLYMLGQVALFRGQLEAAESYLQQSLAIMREVGDRHGEGANLNTLGQVALYRGQLEAAEAFLQQGLAICREVGDRQGEGVNLYALGQVALYRGQLEAAEAFLQQGLAICREVGDRQGEARNLGVLGRVAEALGDPVRAEASYRSSLALATERGLGPEIAEAQLALGRLLAARLDHREEGCSLLLEAARRFSEMEMPEAADAREAAERLRCTGESG